MRLWFNILFSIGRDSFRSDNELEPIFRVIRVKINCPASSIRITVRLKCQIIRDLFAQYFQNSDGINCNWQLTRIIHFKHDLHGVSIVNRHSKLKWADNKRGRKRKKKGMPNTCLLCRILENIWTLTLVGRPLELSMYCVTVSNEALAHSYRIPTLYITIWLQPVHSVVWYCTCRVKLDIQCVLYGYARNTFICSHRCLMRMQCACAMCVCNMRVQYACAICACNMRVQCACAMRVCNMRVQCACAMCVRVQVQS